MQTKMDTVITDTQQMYKVMQARMDSSVHYI